MKLNLGCGDKVKEGYLGVDIIAYPNVDIVRDITRGIPFSNGTVEAVFASHFMEHIERTEVTFVLEEVHRVLEVGGEFHFIVPHARSNQAFMMGHLSYWEKSTVEVLCGEWGSPDHFANVRFEIVKNELINDVELEVILKKIL